MIVEHKHICRKHVIANVQNVCYLIDREDYKNGRIVPLSTSILNYLTKN